MLCKCRIIQRGRGTASTTLKSGHMTMKSNHGIEKFRIGSRYREIDHNRISRSISRVSMDWMKGFESIP